MRSSQSPIAQTAAVCSAISRSVVSGIRGLIFGLMAVLWLASPAQTADITVSSRGLFGGAIIHIDGFINVGDETRFARIASQYPEGTVVELDGPGGVVGPALDIAKLVWKRGFDTMLTKRDECASACAYIWLSGRHAVIQRNTELGFHQAYHPNTMQSDPEADEVIMAHLQSVGLTAKQAWALVHAAPPKGVRYATEQWAYQLGFQPQIVPTPFAMRTCQSKFCLSFP